ncbi:hypothetical protein BD779DRAFT_1563403 [Infundibulicybe gibba]|nr:hypothetical protein BD779DRAFT_1563403 [Infundibulicybe gibba]
MLHLPAELVIQIFGYLPLSSLANWHLVSHYWRQFCQTHETALFRHAAILHDMIPPSLLDLRDICKIYPSASLRGVGTWKDLCQKRIRIQQSWLGQAPSKYHIISKSGQKVHRIKVDESAGFVITTSSDGGIRVSDIKQDRLLWRLPETYVRRFAHCEYDEGYMIFDRLDGSKDVWRRADLYDAEQARDVKSPPDNLQLMASSVASLGSFSPGRGHFLPWALLRPPGPAYAYRFVHPTLLVSSSRTAFLWDIPTGALIQTIPDIQQPYPAGTNATEPTTLGELRYVEVNEKYIFLCGTNTLRIFSRSDGKIRASIRSRVANYGSWTFTLTPDGPTSWGSGALPVRQKIEVCRSPPPVPPLPVDEFTAVHVSKCGRHLVALLESSRVIILPNFERIMQGVDVYDIAIDVQLGSPRLASTYLAFENGRIAAATTSGLFLIQPDWSDPCPNGSPPSMSICRLPLFNNQPDLFSLSCLQMTDIGLYFNWSEPVYREYSELLYHRSLSLGPSFVALPNSEQALVFYEVPEGAAPGLSTVFRVDFTGDGASEENDSVPTG